MVRLAAIAMLALLAPAVWAEDYVADLDAFFAAADEQYPFFDLKGIRDFWEETKTDLRARVSACESDDDFLPLLAEAVAALNDSHAGIIEARVPMPTPEPEYYPAMGFMEGADGAVLVMESFGTYKDSMPAGTEVLTIDGRPAKEVLDEQAEAAWLGCGQSSPQRAALYVWRIPLRGKEGDRHVVTYRYEGNEQGAELICDRPARGWPHTYNMPKKLNRFGKNFMGTVLPSGVGYVYLRGIDNSVAEGFARAFYGNPKVTAYIVDLRGNGGGGYDNTLIEQFKRFPGPVAVLIDAGCISAGETVARDLVHLANARIFGQTSAGASSVKTTVALPSGVATVRFSIRTRSGVTDPIEFTGIAPDEAVLPTAADTQAGRNTAILHAEAWLLERLGQE